jgi:hypothetical protein
LQGFDCAESQRFREMNELSPIPLTNHTMVGAAFYRDTGGPFGRGTKSVYNGWVVKDSLGIEARAGASAVPAVLRESPARFLPDAWARLVVLKGNPAEALDALDHPDSGLLVHYRREFLAQGAGSAESRQRAARDEEIYLLTEKIVADFRNLGAEGRLIATGLYVGTGLRQEFPLELWADAKVEFAAGRVTSGNFEYHAVTVREAEHIADEDTLIGRIRAWLEARRCEHGEEKKSALLKAAGQEFGDELTVRTFNSGYSAAYGRKRGRPGKRNK